MTYSKFLISTLILNVSFLTFAFGVESAAPTVPTSTPEAVTSQCEQALLPINVPKMLKAIIAEEPDQAFRGEVYKSYMANTKTPALRRLLPRNLIKAVIVDANNRYYPKVLEEALERLPSFASNHPEMTAVDRMRAALRATLEGKVNASSVDERISALDGDSPDRVVRALGDMSLDEVGELYYGADPLNPSKGSLLRQYLDNTGASAIAKSFSNGPDKGDTFGPERLVVAVSADTFAEYQRLFVRLDNLAPIGHAGIIQNGEMRGWHTGGMRLPGPGNILPTVLLKTTEAQRAEQYFKMMVLARTNGLGWQYWNNPMMQPWMLNNYCTQAGGYSCCTHWIGNMPLGDELVSSYTFPPRVDNNPNGVVPAPIVAALKPYEHANAMVKRIWSTPGHQQFGEMIGQGEANARGDMASPGWVITTLIGPTAVERVPVVFYFVADHKAPLKASLIPQFERPW